MFKTLRKYKKGIYKLNKIFMFIILPSIHLNFR